MKLIYANASPFARKVRVFASEAGLSNRIETQPTAVVPTDPNSLVTDLNPLGKIPVLITNEGQVLADSKVICEYLDSLASTSLIGSGSERWAVLSAAAWADGLMEAALLIRYEQLLRPPEQQSEAWIAGQRHKIHLVLERFESNDVLEMPQCNLAQIALASALGYLDFRLPEMAWRDGKPKLEGFYATFAERPSMATSRPE